MTNRTYNEMRAAMIQMKSVIDVKDRRAQVVKTVLDLLRMNSARYPTNDLALEYQTSRIVRSDPKEALIQAIEACYEKWGCGTFQ